MSFQRPAFLAYAIALIVLALDQASKFWVLEGLHLAARQHIYVAPFFKLSMVWNPGISFGLLRADNEPMRWALVAFAAIVVAFLAVWAWRQTRTLVIAGLGLIMGGAIGNNFIDRARFGKVVDFLDFGPLFPWVFNVADTAISVGVALLLLDALRNADDGAARAAAKASEDPSSAP